MSKSNYDWHEYISGGDLHEVESTDDGGESGGSGLPTVEIPDIFYDDGPREDYFSGMLADFENALEGLTEDEKQQVFAAIMKGEKSNLTWQGLKVIRQKMNNMLRKLFESGLIASIPESLKGDVKEPNNSPSKGVWKRPRLGR